MSVTPTKTGVISLKEGESIKEVAFSFCRAYQLNSATFEALVAQLDTHLKEYYKKHMLQTILDKNLKNADQKIFNFQNNKDIMVGAIDGGSVQNFQLENTLDA